MKKLLTLIIITISFLTSCKKETEKESKCPVLDPKLIPTAVSNTFSEKYPKQAVFTWFKKDKKGYAAYFLNNGIQTLSLFSNEAGFLKEEIKGQRQQNGNHEDDGEGCGDIDKLSQLHSS